ncbi:DUF1275 family protein [Serinibacter salmoneus]|uniref:Uncharacterized membrane protein YoaK (UPF0700 family) n=1 Tax=Serinibacter salmoneus TaxID=556530 RepID=A0A2A9CX44_9MICO|nr:YoaK family protein [Serinibacter salmoneus]PFG18973.1 uncharacterized membrane protein YoaK (UPF0700 family) [Serinibacter salmoneus]
MTTYKQIDSHPEAVRFPLMELPVIGFVLAFVCGTLNAWTLMNAATFATVQSGNVASSGIYLATGEWSKFLFAWGSVIAFGLGSFVCGYFMTTWLRKGRVYTVPVLWAEGLIIALMAVLWATSVIPETKTGAQIVCFVVSFVAGAQGNSFHKNHGMLYGNVAVTFVVQAAFNFLVQSFINKKGINGEPNLKWSGIFFLVLLGFAGGGAIGALTNVWLGWEHDATQDGVLVNGTPVAGTGWALLLPAALTIILALIAGRQKHRNLDPDPTAGGLIP